MALNFEQDFFLFLEREGFCEHEKIFNQESAAFIAFVSGKCFNSFLNRMSHQLFHEKAVFQALYAQESFRKKL
jgi:hypothetical protein